MKILISKNKIKSLEKELERLKEEIFLHDKSNADQGTMTYSFNDAAVSEILIKPKRKREKEIKSILKDAKELPQKIDSEKAVLGSWVYLEGNNKKRVKYRLVHPIEAAPQNNLLSVQSPLGKLLLNKKASEQVKFRKKKFKIIKID